ncbi:MAG: L-aspartate oxidase [Rhodospirillaceae bacterium]|nr:L-aspartate oxidase [Rhodospirillaceae bacterium]
MYQDRVLRPARPEIVDAPRVIVGSGIAGLSAALALAPQPVVVLTGAARGGASWLAQGGVACALGPDDTPRLHAEDTVAVGAGLTDPALARLLTAEGVERIGEVIAAGMAFDRSADGALALGLEAGHRRHRIVHADGDGTGRALMTLMLEAARRTPSITLAEGVRAWDLLVADERVQGLLAVDAVGRWIVYRTAQVVLATGGIGQVYSHTTNPPGATGDGLAMAARAGAALADLEFVQFHPTALAAPGAPAGAPLPLLTEALRGHGAVLRDAAGHRFMPDEHPDAELAPRDVVARAVWRHRRATGAVVLDATEAVGDRFPTRFPTAYTLCRAAGLDPRVEPIPVTPAAHYHMGGVLVDADGRTTLAGLWACGEVASTGVHGGNRLASNSLLEGLVFGHRVAADLAQHGAEPPASGLPTVVLRPAVGAIDGRLAALRKTMYDHVGLERDGAGLGRALAMLDALQSETEMWPAAAGDLLPVPADGAAEVARLRNLSLVGRLIATAAERRSESRGAHLRSDHPGADPAWQHRQILYAGALTGGVGASPAILSSTVAA